MAKKNKKELSVDDVLASIEKKYGSGAIMKLSKNYKLKNIDVISTGSLGLDNALGVGGIPKGRVIEIYGPESSGKTSLTYSIISECQLNGGRAAFIDAEHALNENYAVKSGINLEELIISQPDTGEQALDIVQTLVESDKLDLIVIDSVAALTPKAEIEGEMEDAQIGLQARLMSKAMRKLTASISKTNTCVIFINQTRMKIGMMFGSPETTSGGKALKFYSSVRIKLNRFKNIKKGQDSVVGTLIKAKVVKNKVAPPFKETTFSIYFDEGVSTAADIMNVAISNGILKKSGAWISYKGENIGQGDDNTRKYLRENPEVMKEIKQQIFSLLGKTKLVEEETIEEVVNEED